MDLLCDRRDHIDGARLGETRGRLPHDRRVFQPECDSGQSARLLEESLRGHERQEELAVVTGAAALQDAADSERSPGFERRSL